MHKKSQLQIGEIIAVLVVFFIITLIGYVVYFNFIRGEVEEQSEEVKELGSVGIAQTTLSLPELQCSDNNIVKEGCFDILKLDIVKEIGDKSGYFDLFEFSTINVKQIYKSSSDISVYDNKPNSYANKFVTNIPIIVYDPINKKNNFGVLEVATYSR